MAADQNRSDADMVVQKPDTIGDADFANYFCTYGYLYHQKDMLEDQSRMTAYHDAVRLNPALFRGKTVLDVGTGSGILAIWAAQCGARKVYAVEATYMATHAKKLVEANGLGDVVEDAAPEFRMLHLPTPEHDRDLDLAAVAQERLDLPGLGGEVARTNLGSILHLLDQNVGRLLARFLGPLGLFVLELPVVHDSAYRRIGLVGHLHQVQAQFQGRVESVR